MGKALVVDIVPLRDSTFVVSPIVLALALYLGPSVPVFSQLTSGSDQTKASAHRSPVNVSICQAFAHLDDFDGKLVQIKATYSATFEGAWISDSTCRDYFGEIVDSDQQGMAREYAVAVQDAKKKFALQGVLWNSAWREFGSACRQLYTGMNAGKYDFISADFTGVLMIRRNFRMQNGFGNGCGHLGASRFLLILTSVSNVTPHPL